MNLSYTQKRLIVFFKNRFFTDLISWTILFLLIVGIMTIDLWRQSEIAVNEMGNYVGFADFVNGKTLIDETQAWLTAFTTIVLESFYILLALAFVAYFNLTFLKDRILNTNLTRWQRIGWYLSSTIIFSLIMGVVWVQLDQFLGNHIRMEVHFIFASILNFCIAILSTGMLTMKELKDAQAQVNNLRKEIANIKTQQQQERDTKEEDLTFYTNHIKVGSKKKWQIVPYEDIYFFKGGGNDPQIFTNTGKIWGSSKLEEYNYFLPKDKFIRVHRSYIIAKEWVRERDGNILYLVDKAGVFLQDKNGEKLGIPISDSYLKDVDADAYLMFEQEVEHQNK